MLLYGYTATSVLAAVVVVCTRSARSQGTIESRSLRRAFLVRFVPWSDALAATCDTAASDLVPLIIMACQGFRGLGFRGLPS